MTSIADDRAIAALNHRRRPNFPTTFLLPILACVLLLLPAHARAQGDPAARVVEKAGDVAVQRTGGEAWLAAIADEALFTGDTIRTGANGRAVLLMADESSVQLNRDTRLTLTAIDGGAGWNRLRGLVHAASRSLRSLYRLVDGEMWIRNNNPDVQVEISTPTVTATLRGTELNIDARDPAVVRIAVLEGRVLAVNEAGQVEAVAGETVIAPLGQAPRREVLLTPRDAVQWTVRVPPLLGVADLPPGNADIANALDRVAAAMAAGEPRAAAEQLAEARAAHPDAAVIEVADALRLAESGDAEAAEALLRPLSGASAPPMVSRALAFVLLLRGNHDQALEVLDTVSADDDAAAWTLRSYLQRARFDLPAAEDAAERAVALAPDDLAAWVNLATLQFADERIDDAAASLRQALTIAPDDSNATALAGYIELARQETAAALASFQAAIDQDAGNAEAWMGRAIARMRGGEVAGAMEDIATAVAIEPQRSLFLSYWGKMLYQVERHDKALIVLDSAARLDPRDPTPLYYRAVILRDLNRAGEAIRTLNQSIALNDNRAVYRSRFLLDQDLASRNVDLSVLYDGLGLNAWARARAIRSVKADPSNYSAHGFLTGALLNEPDRAYPAANEGLLTRILLPANVNSFNSFNEYTAFFEQPDFDASATVTVGTQDREELGLALSGAVPDANLAYSVGFADNENSGWRDTNGDEFDDLATIVKWQPTPVDGFLFAASDFTARQDDENFPRFEFDAPPDPDAFTRSDNTRIELGYHRDLDPRSDFLLYVASFDTELGLRDDRDTPLGGGVTRRDVLLAEAARPYDQVQAQYMRHVDEHYLVAGALHFDGRQSASTSTRVFGISDGITVPFPEFDAASDFDLDTRFTSIYVQDSWQYSPEVLIEGAVHHERMDNANAFTGGSWTVEETNPRLGLAWTPNHRDTVRVGAFRYLLPFVAPRLDPTDVAGLFIFRNTEEGALVTEVDAAWERELDDAFFSVNVFSVDRELTERPAPGAPLTVTRGNFDGVEFEYNRLLNERTGLVASIGTASVDDGFFTELDRRDTAASLALNYIAPGGMFAGVTQTWRRIDFDGAREDEDILITDVNLGYQLPQRRGVVALQIRNLFDNEFNWVTDRFIALGRAPAREVLATVRINLP